MKRWPLFLAVVVAIGALVAGVNVFGRELNTLFLRYPGIDKVLHVTGYLTVFLIVFGISGGLWPDRSVRARWAAALTMLLSISDEALQSLMPARSLELLDVLASLAGVTLGWMVVRRRRDALAMAVASVALVAAGYTVWETHLRLGDYVAGLRAARERDFVAAREHFQRAYANGLRTAEMFNELGWVEIESGRGDAQKAVQYARTALDMQPENYDILDTYAWALHHAGRTREAIEILERVYAARPNMFCIHYHLASAYLAAGEREKAEFHFLRQVERTDTREALFARQALDRMGHNQ